MLFLLLGVKIVSHLNICFLRLTGCSERSLEFLMEETAALVVNKRDRF